MTGAIHLLLVEDDATTRRSVSGSLVAHGYAVDEAGSAREAFRHWEARRPDLILLDLGLPDFDGLAVVQRVRKEAATPILVLSARGLERDKVTALEQGADDYVTKPFGMAELHARVTALLRRAAGPAADAQGVVRAGPIELDAAQHLDLAADVGERLHEAERLEHDGSCGLIHNAAPRPAAGAPR